MMRWMNGTNSGGLELQMRISLRLTRNKRQRSIFVVGIFISKALEKLRAFWSVPHVRALFSKLACIHYVYLYNNHK